MTHSANNRWLQVSSPIWPILILSVLLLGAVSLSSWAAPKPRHSVRFAVIGDYGSGSQGEADIANMIRTWHPDFIITTGDNRYGGHPYDQVVGYYFCDYLKDTLLGERCHGGNARSNAFFPSLGNHDYREGRGIREYLDYFTLPGKDFPYSTGNERYYDFVRGPVHFFALNSNPEEPDGNQWDSVQAAWLKRRLSESSTPWQIVYFHHPPYSSGDHGSSRWMQWPFGVWGADAVLSGHDHTYERLQVGGIPHFVNGLGGKSRYGFSSPLPPSRIRYNGNYGAMLIEAEENQIRFRFINRAGIVIDDFRLTKPNSSPEATHQSGRAPSKSGTHP